MFMSFSLSGRTRRQEGSVLIFALFVLIFLASVALVASYRVHQQLALTQRLVGQARSLAIAQSAVALVTRELEHDKSLNQVDHLAEAWQAEYVRSGQPREQVFSDVAGNPVGHFRVVVQDEHAKINMNTATEKTWQCLLAPFSSATSESVARDIQLYRQDKQPNPVFDSPAELLQVPGVKRDIFLGEDVNDNAVLDPGEDTNQNGQLDLGLKDFLTVVTNGTVNVNTAPENVLACLPGMSMAAAREVVAARKLTPFSKGAELPARAIVPAETYQQISRWVTVSSDLFKVSVWAQDRPAGIAKEVTVILDRSQLPTKIRWWRENQVIP